MAERDCYTDLNLNGNKLIAGSIELTGAPYLLFPCQGRLTLQSGEPESTTDQTAKTTLYYTPYNGNLITLWDGTKWGLSAFTELSLSLSGLTANTNYDTFLYSNAGTLTLQAVAWSSSTARAIAVSRRDGIWVKTSDDRRLLGSFRTTASTGQCEDSEAKRFVNNLYNQVPRTLHKEDFSNNWTHGSSVWRQTRLSAANQVELVLCQPAPVRLNHSGYSGENGAIGIGLDSTSAPASKSTIAIHGATGTPATTIVSKQATLDTTLGIGYHTLAMLEYSVSGTTTFYGFSVGSSPSTCKLAGYIWG